MFKKFYFIFLFSIFFFILLFNFSSRNTSNYDYPCNIRYLSSEYGYREIFGSISFHDGIDFPIPQGTEIFASNSGIVQFVGFLNGYREFCNTLT